MHRKGRRHRMTAGIVVALVVVLGVGGIAAVVLQVDDWRRDLTTNVAETSRDASDPLMRPIRTDRLVGSTARAVRRAAGGLRGWRFVGDSDVEDGIELRFVRVTKWFRFTDDIRVAVEDRGVDRLIHVHSASRIGGADLGQNPRNIRELTRALRELVRDGSATPY